MPSAASFDHGPAKAFARVGPTAPEARAWARTRPSPSPKPARSERSSPAVEQCAHECGEEEPAGIQCEGPGKEDPGDERRARTRGQQRPHRSAHPVQRPAKGRGTAASRANWSEQRRADPGAPGPEPHQDGQDQMQEQLHAGRREETLAEQAHPASEQQVGERAVARVDVPWTAVPRVRSRRRGPSVPARRGRVPDRSGARRTRPRPARRRRPGPRSGWARIGSWSRVGGGEEFAGRRRW